MAAYVDIRKSRNRPAQSLKLHLALGFGLFTVLLSAGISFLVGHVIATEGVADIERLQLQIISVGALLGLVFAGLALWFAARVAEPLTDIADAADRLSSGERGVFIPRESRYSEVERLSASLHTMLSNFRRQEEDLLQARDKLELRVRERAADLTRTRAELEAKIIDLERAQREAAQSKERLDLALDAAGVAVWTCDVVSGRIEFSEQWAEIVGSARAITVTSLEAVLALVPEQERLTVRAAMDAAVAGQVPSYVRVHHIRTANGGLAAIVSRGKVIERGPDGRATVMAGTVRALNEEQGQPTLPPRARSGS